MRGLTLDTTEGQPPQAFQEALEDDLNTPQAITVLFECLSDLNAAKSPDDKDIAAKAMLACGRYLGILQQDPETWFRWGGENIGTLSDGDIDQLVADRAAARQTKNFAESDRIRDELLEAGIILEDKAAETIWRRK